MSTALVVIDVQESFRQLPLWPAVSRPDIVDRVHRLVEHARSQGHRVIWVLHSEPGSRTPFDPDRGAVRLMDGLEPLDGEPTFVKTSRNAFTTTALGQYLTREGVDRVVITGIQTEQCCETTARLAADLGYAVDFVTEATATFPIAHRDAPQGRELNDVLADPTTLSADQIEKRTEYALAGRFARIVTLADAMGVEPVRH